MNWGSLFAARNDKPHRLPSAQQAKLLLEGISDGVVNLGGGGDAVVLEIQAKNLALVSTEEQDQIVTAFSAFLNGLDFPIQTLVRIERFAARDYLSSLTKRSQSVTDARMRQIALAQLGFVRELASSRLLLQRHFLLVIPFIPPQTRVGVSISILRWLWPKEAKAMAPFAVAKRQLELRRDQVIRGLESVGLKAHALDSDEILTLYYRALCPTQARIQPFRQPLRAALVPVIQKTLSAHHLADAQTREGRVDRRRILGGQHVMSLGRPKPAHSRKETDTALFLRGMRTVADLIAPASWEVHRSYLRLDDVYLRSLVVVGLPRSVSTAWLAPLIGFPEPLDLTIHAVPLEPAQAIQTLTQRMVQLQSSRLLDAGEGRLADSEREIAYSDCERLRDALQRGDENIFSVGISLTIRAATIPELDRLTSLVETTLAGMLAQSRRCTFEHEAGLRSSLPEARDHLGSVATSTPPRWRARSLSIPRPWSTLKGSCMGSTCTITHWSSSTRFTLSCRTRIAASSPKVGWASPSRSSSNCCAPLSRESTTL